jgi:2,3-bisphosphoglycerate-dependent phosphoglycerate mutase
MELVLVRHAEPIRIGPGESAGEAVDPELTRRGCDQAQRLAAWLAGETVHHVVSSPLRRAWETAQPVAAAHGLKVEIEDGLQEWDANADHYIPMEELRETKGDRWQAMIDGRWEDYGGENPERFRDRIVPKLEGVIDTHPGENVVVVCHGGVINVYLAALLGLSHHLWFDPGYTSISRVRAARAGARSLTSLNETAHLYAAREPLR